MIVGIDIGSTTTKIAAVDELNKNIIFSNYIRHNAHQIESVYTLLSQLKEYLSIDAEHMEIRLVFTGSGAKGLSEKTMMGYVQEVVANSIALQEMYETVGTAIELGGQDAKMIFFQGGGDKGPLRVADMRMNGSCAGGTG